MPNKNRARSATSTTPPFDPKVVAQLLHQNEQLRADLDAVRRTAEELNERMRGLLEASAQQDAERKDISKDIRQRFKPTAADDALLVDAKGPPRAAARRRGRVKKSGD